jgi:hypothetical protein
MNRSLVYILKQPLLDRDLERYGILELHADGNQICIIDLTEVLHPETPRPAKPARLPNDVDVIEPANWHEFEQLEDRVRKADLVFLFIQSYGLSAATLTPLKMLGRTRTPYAIQGTTSVPGASNHVHQPMSQPLSSVWARLRRMNLKNSIVSRLPPEVLNIPKAKYALVPCAEEISIANNSLVGPKTQMVPLHTADYETFIKAKSSAKIDGAAKTKTAVFIDQNIPYHIDYNELNAHPIDPDEYYGQLRAAFDTIEGNTGIHIEIAMHPRAAYEDFDPRFGGRPAQSGRTMEMIARSDLVLTHHSTAIGFAVLFQKPIALLMSQKLYRRHTADQAYFDSFSRELGTPLRSIDNMTSNTFDGLFDINLRRYERYAERYLRHEDAEEAPNWIAAKRLISEIEPETSSLKQRPKIDH